MKVGVLGSGTVAQTLAAGFIKHGHQTMIGTRDKAKLADWLKKNPKAQVGSFGDAAAFGDVVVLAVKGSAAEDVLRAAGTANLEGKLVMDACNPIADAPPVNGVLRFFTSLDDSLMERLQREFPTAHFVKAFNSVGAPRMVNPEFKAGKPTMFICGNDDNAKAVTTQDPGPVRLGDGGHGQGGSGARHRAALHAMVHSWVHEERVDPRVQAAASMTEQASRSRYRRGVGSRTSSTGQTGFTVY